jgi:hypothetical protein
MTFTPDRPTKACPVCGWEANILAGSFGRGEVVDCYRCGDYQISHDIVADLRLPYKDPLMRALVSHTVRQMHPPKRPRLTEAFFQELQHRTLPTPAEASDNLIRWMASQVQERPGKAVRIEYESSSLQGAIGVVDRDEAAWVTYNLLNGGLANGPIENNGCSAILTAKGWLRFEELRQAKVASKFAFFARQFANDELDALFETCLRPAVLQTGYDLRTATQRAGLIDSVIEDEIRRCRFVIADLSDDNAGAYWEGGFAQGLGKDVIYICRANGGDGVPKKTHFDTDHRQVVRWGDSVTPEETAQKLKAVIRNTLLGDAMQDE